MVKKAASSGSETMLPKSSFELLVKEFYGVNRTTKGPFRFKRLALLELQKSVETAFNGFLRGAAKCTIHAGRVSVTGKDMRCVLDIGTWKKYDAQKFRRKYTTPQGKRVDQALRKWISKPAIRRMIMTHSRKVRRVNGDAYDEAYRILCMYIFGALDISGVITQSS